jgi:membrane-associated phospholipid phosphatase
VVFPTSGVRAGYWPAPARRWLAPLDQITLGYTLFSAIVLVTLYVTGDPRISRIEFTCLMTAHGLLLLLVGLAATARSRPGDTGRLLAEWYPLVVLLAVYGSIGLVNGPRAWLGQSFDPQILYWEGRLAGASFLIPYTGYSGTPTLTWLLGISYLAFFPMVIASPMVLWVMGRRDHARRAIFGITLTFLTCYILFLLFPVAGPAYLWGWPDAQTDADLPVRLVRRLNDRHDSWGSAFPSSHVAASVAAVGLAFGGCRRLGVAIAPVALGILLAVIYFRVHYVLDAVAGLALAGVVVWGVHRVWQLEPARG